MAGLPQISIGSKSPLANSIQQSDQSPGYFMLVTLWGLAKTNFVNPSPLSFVVDEAPIRLNKAAQRVERNRGLEGKERRVPAGMQWTCRKKFTYHDIVL